MNELIDFLISNDVDYEEDNRTLIFKYKSCRYIFNFKLKTFRVMTAFISSYGTFKDFECRKDNCNNYIEIFIADGSTIIWFDKEN